MSLSRASASYATVAISIVAILVLGLTNYVTITKGGPPSQNTFSVTGTGSVLAIPDQLVLNLGVETEAPSASQALQSNTQAMNQVVANLKALGLSDSELSTSNFAVQPVYAYPKDAPPVLTGYKATNTVTIVTNNTARAGDYIDTAVNSGANQVNFIYFAVSDQKQAQIKGGLISLAVNDAKTKAQNALAPLGLDILGVQTMTISESGYPIVYARGEKAVASTPILPGQQRVTVTVQISFLIGSK